MKIFLSYSSSDRSLVEPILLALRSQNHRVFFDRFDLPPGEEFHARIREAIEGSDLFIFLLSPDSIGEDKYTLSELEIARQSWGHPAGKVLPVMLRPVAIESIPSYLKAVTIFDPAGDAAASVADSVHRIEVRRRRRRLVRGLAGAAAITALVVAGALYYWRSLEGHETKGKDGAPAALVAEGSFLMGDDEVLPRKEIYLDAFYMDRYEITASRYADFLKATGPARQPDGWESVDVAVHGEKPVVGVNWFEADAYCRWAGKRLPTEAEWEKAARGTDGRVYPWGGEDPDPRLATFLRKASLDAYEEGLSPVGSHDSGKSPYGIHDMAGNAYEWVGDWFMDGYVAGQAMNPAGPATGTEKVLRGGGWRDPPQTLMTTQRGRAGPNHRAEDIGFRCARS